MGPTDQMPHAKQQRLQQQLQLLRHQPLLRSLQVLLKLPEQPPLLLLVAVQVGGLWSPG
jgi:hypothetical protein